MQRARAYALAVVSQIATESTPDRMVSSLMHALKKKGELSLLPKIVREVSKELERRGKTEHTTLTIARASDAASIQTSLASQPSSSNAHIDRVVVDNRLVGGFTLGSAGSYLDASYRTRLIKLFNSLV